MNVHCFYCAGEVGAQLVSQAASGRVVSAACLDHRQEHEHRIRFLAWQRESDGANWGTARTETEGEETA